MKLRFQGTLQEKKSFFRLRLTIVYLDHFTIIKVIHVYTHSIEKYFLIGLHKVWETHMKTDLCRYDMSHPEKGNEEPTDITIRSLSVKLI